MCLILFLFQPKVKWLDPEGKPISDSGPLRVEETRLYLESASSKRNNGNYTCVAENLAGIRSETVRLIVSSKFHNQAIFTFQKVRNV